MSNFNDSLEEVFDMTPSQPISTKKPPKAKAPKSIISILGPSGLEQDLSDAYSQTKDNLQEFIDNGMDALDELLQISKESQSPRSFEVYSSLLKVLIEANSELLSVQKQIRDMDKGPESQTNIEKALFVGSTHELSKFLKDIN